jgi:hypothetical protein
MYLFRIYFSYCPAQSKTHIHHLLLSLLFPFTTAISVDLRHDNQLAIVAPAPDILRRKYKPHAYPHILPFFRSRHSIFTTKTFFHQNFSSPQHKVLLTLTMDAFLFWCFLAALLGWLAVEMMHDPLVPIRAPAPLPPAPTTTTTITSNPLPPRAVRRALAHRPLAAKPFSFVPVSSGLATTLPSTWRAYPTLGTQMHRPRSNEDKISAGRGASSAGAVHCAWSPAPPGLSSQHRLAKPRRSAQEIWAGFDFTPTPLVSPQMYQALFGVPAPPTPFARLAPPTPFADQFKAFCEVSAGKPLLLPPRLVGVLAAATFPALPAPGSSVLAPPPPPPPAVAAPPPAIPGLEIDFSAPIFSKAVAAARRPRLTGRRPARP